MDAPRFPIPGDEHSIEWPSLRVEHPSLVIPVRDELGNVTVIRNELALEFLVGAEYDRHRLLLQPRDRLALLRLAFVERQAERALAGCEPAPREDRDLRCVGRQQDTI